MFKWVPDGTYDALSLFTRYVIVNGKPKTVISDLWLRQGGPDDVHPDLRRPFGTYPDMPPKPEKK